jgi:glycerol-3-phosphate acyltransferase PlsY
VPFAGYILVALLGYLLGSIPTGYLVARARGLDIRMVGSGNIGATNVFRILGKPAGIFVLIMDAAKGWVAVAIGTRLVAKWLDAYPDDLHFEWLQLCAGVASVLGHNYTCWLRFKGGKGVATSAGVLLALVPWALLVIVSLWVVVLVLTRYVSLASICASAALPLSVWLIHYSRTMIAIAAGLSCLAIYKHKANIRRLLEGTENRFGRKIGSLGEPEPGRKS